MKNTWSSYLRYKKIEMFYADGYITYKGVPKDMIQQHTLGLNKYLCNVFEKLENYDADVLKYIAKFQKMYLQDKLQEHYYIPFGYNGSFKVSNLDLLGYIANIVLCEVNSW